MGKVWNHRHSTKCSRSCETK